MKEDINTYLLVLLSSNKGIFFITSATKVIDISVHTMPETKKSPTQEYVDYKLTSDLPEITSDIEYKVPNVLKKAIFMAAAHSTPFWGIFFGQGGPDWPWWSLCFIVNALIQLVSPLFNDTASLVRHPGSLEFKNFWGQTIGEPGTFDLYESVAIKKVRSSHRVYIVRTDAHMNNMKREHKISACCIGKEMELSFSEKDVRKFASDHDLSM